MNLLLLEPEEVAAGIAHLADERRTIHLRKVLKVEVGRSLRVGIIGGGQGIATITAIGSRGIDMRVEVDSTPASGPPTTTNLIMALPRPAVLHRVLQNAATMGIGRLALVNAWRVEKSFFQSPALRAENIRRHLILGAEQGGTTALPEVEIHPRLVPFLRQLPPVPPETSGRIVAHPETSRPLEAFWPDGLPARIQIAIGPEGGWIDRELATFEEVGFITASLGTWILRVESAMTAAVAQIALLRRHTLS